MGVFFHPLHYLIGKGEKIMKKNLKKIMATIATAAMVFGLTACSAATSTPRNDNTVTNETTGSNGTENSDGLETIELAVPGQDGNYVAEIVSLAIKGGYIEEELNKVGFTAHWNAFLTGTEINEALAGGSVVGGGLGDMPVFIANASGVASTIIAQTNSKLQYAILSANNEIQKPKDLEGKKIIVNQGTVLQHFWDIYVEANNLNVSAIEIINSNDPTSLLSSGEADAYVTTLTSAYFMEYKGLGSVFVNGAEIAGSYSTTVFELENGFLAEHPEVAVAINKALIRAYENAIETPQDFYESLENESQPADVVALSYNWNPTLEQLSPEITQETMDSYKAFNEWLVENQLIGAEVDIDTLIDTQYYEKAIAELGK